MSHANDPAEQSWNQMIKNCRCEAPGHHVFYMKHWRATGLRCPQTNLRWIGGTAFEFDHDGTKFTGHIHCPDVVNEMLNSGLQIDWRYDARDGGDEFHVVALWDGGSKLWLSFDRKPVPDCGANVHDCKPDPDDIFDEEIF